MVLDDVDQYAERPVPPELLGRLRMAVTDAAGVKELRATAKELALYLDPDLMRQVRNEIADITEDIKWAKTPEGRFRLMVNGWAEGVYAEKRAHPEWLDIYIATRPDDLGTIVVFGEAHSQADLEAFQTFLAGKSQPVDVRYDVRIIATD